MRASERELLKNGGRLREMASVSRDAISSFIKNPTVVRVSGEVMHYDWGERGYTAYIPKLLGVDAAGLSFAELWFGDHPALPSKAALGRQLLPLNLVVSEAVDGVLGAAASQKAALPLLLKIIAAARPLSIQCHPNDEQARVGFEQDNTFYSENDVRRTYKDSNGKPEMLLALTDFWIAVGFDISGEAVNRLRRRLSADFHKYLRHMPDRVVNFVLNYPEKARSLAAALMSSVKRENPTDPHDPGTWLKRLFQDTDDIDAGPLFLSLMNIRCLRRGEAVFIKPGTLHAYLAGVGVEVMKSSDNVIRAGLTPKRINLRELKRVADPSLQGHFCSPNRGVYELDEMPFYLKSLELSPNTVVPLDKNNAPILGMVLTGSVFIESGNTKINLQKGDGFLCPAASFKNRIIAMEKGAHVVWTSTLQRSKS